jgi:D-lyxose ketol-isomerase
VDVKRSEINAIIRSADAFIQACGFHLPPFAYWTPQDWAGKGAEVAEVINHRLGWDITDFGQGQFAQCGLFLFTLRNGHPSNWQTLRGKLYAEKLMIVEPGQVTPLHFHWKKMEDIINRSGGQLVIQLYNSTLDESLDLAREVIISIDGVQRTVKAGGTVTLAPGESIALPPGCYHQFWGAERRVLVGEVSMVNDDSQDNRFHEPVGRFPTIEADEPPLYLLVSDYDHYLGGISHG